MIVEKTVAFAVPQNKEAAEQTGVEETEVATDMPQERSWRTCPRNECGNGPWRSRSSTRA